MLGIPHLSLLIVNEKQQLMKPSSTGLASSSVFLEKLFWPATIEGSEKNLNSFCGDQKGNIKPETIALLITGLPEPTLRTGLYRRTQDVRTAFWLESKATCPYFWGEGRGGGWKWSNHHSKSRKETDNHLPIIHSRLFRHELIDTQSPIAHQVTLNPNQLRKLPVGLVDFACPSPETSRDAHRRENAVIVKKHPLECLFDENKVLDFIFQSPRGKSSSRGKNAH